MGENPRDLLRSLDRAREALAKTRRENTPIDRGKAGPGPHATMFGAVALVLLVFAVFTGNHALLYAAIAAAVGGFLFASPQARALLAGLTGQGDRGHAQIGIGATVAADAVVEPGARMEMGASVGARAAATLPARAWGCYAHPAHGASIRVAQTARPHCGERRLRERRCRPGHARVCGRHHTRGSMHDAGRDAHCPFREVLLKLRRRSLRTGAGPCPRRGRSSPRTSAAAAEQDSD